MLTSLLLAAALMSVPGSSSNSYTYLDTGEGHGRVWTASLVSVAYVPTNLMSRACPEPCWA